MFLGFIDPPSPFAPLEEWIEFRSSMEKIRPRTADIQEYIDQANAEIERLKGQPETD
ncbi:hypothetical protein [Mesorhizobium sp. WSM4887]|uniref:hypothetical protein n=1 Tax=Mesorhizobium sp. WSM4887 TaxID=3038543 RepID=UPI0024171DBE|nr:hypothetical protein [Mesorhizobium sp. WSM4887]MDG4886807.1 hypothetical protein [Mesorhizobium sp. WSM4887]